MLVGIFLGKYAVMTDADAVVTDVDSDVGADTSLSASTLQAQAQIYANTVVYTELGGNISAANGFSYGVTEGVRLFRGLCSDEWAVVRSF